MLLLNLRFINRPHRKHTMTAHRSTSTVYIHSEQTNNVNSIPIQCSNTTDETSAYTKLPETLQITSSSSAITQTHKTVKHSSTTITRPLPNFHYFPIINFSVHVYIQSRINVSKYLDTEENIYTYAVPARLNTHNFLNNYSQATSSFSLVYILGNIRTRKIK